MATIKPLSEETLQDRAAAVRDYHADQLRQRENLRRLRAARLELEKEKA